MSILRNNHIKISQTIPKSGTLVGVFKLSSILHRLILIFYTKSEPIGQTYPTDHSRLSLYEIDGAKP